MGKKIDLTSVVIPSEDVVVREIEGELIIVPLVAGIGDMEEELFTLNKTGKAVWKMLDGKKSLRQVAKELSAEFEASPMDIEKDVLSLVKELSKRRILVDASKI